MFYYERFLVCNIQQQFTFEIPLCHPMGTTVEQYDNLATKSIASHTVNKNIFTVLKKAIQF